MNRFQKNRFGKTIFENVNLSILFFVVVIFLFLYGISVVSDSSVYDEARILSDAINRDIIHCYAIEGMYPPSIDYIEEHYGLNYNHKKYLVDYEVFGTNIMPKVTIIEK